MTGVRALVDPIAGMDSVDLASRLTLILILLSDWVVGEDWWFSLPLRLLALVGLLSPPRNRSLGLWVLLLLFLGAKTVANWWTQDNHLFLLTYWCLAMSLALTLEQPATALGTSARLLVGLSFLFAVLWKGILSPDFLNGGYFQFTFLTDRRFEELATIVGGIPAAMHQYNRTAMDTLMDITARVEAVHLHGTPRLVWTTQLVTWWTLALESAIALTFLWPAGGRLARYRHFALMLFAWSTYTTVTNVGVSFGWVLMILGAAQCEPERRLTRVLYAATCCLLLVYFFAPVLTPFARAAPVAVEADATVSQEDVLQRLASGNAPLVLDVRTRGEFAAGHVTGAINIPHAELGSRLGEIAAARGRDLVVYCEQGNRARFAADVLGRSGFTSVRHLEGDMAAWRARQRPVETSAPRP